MWGVGQLGMQRDLWGDDPNEGSRRRPGHPALPGGHGGRGRGRGSRGGRGDAAVVVVVDVGETTDLIGNMQQTAVAEQACRGLIRPSPCRWHYTTSPN